MAPLKIRVAPVDIQSTSNAVWWIKNPRNKTSTLRQSERKQSLSTSFSQDLKDLFGNMSLHGYSKLLDPELVLWEKLIWLAVHTTTLVALFLVLTATWEQFVAQYFAINLHDPLYPVEKVPFPAVSICSNNRISYDAALDYAQELKNKDPFNRTLDFFLRRVQYYNFMFDKQEMGEDIDYESLTDFQLYLDNYDIWDNETFFNTKKIMKRLAPSCQAFIVQCGLAAVEIPCFGSMAFQDSFTMYGACCTFNAENVYRQRNFSQRFVDSNLGLTVILNSSREDNFSPILNIDGYIVIVHSPTKFADINSGGSQEVFPTHGEESFLSIRARLIDTDAELRTFGPQTRKCYFDDEAPQPEMLMKSSYSFTNCITRCRMRSILALCRCLPFFMPLSLVDHPDGVVYCTLQHIWCLKRYIYKWRNVLTQRDTIPGLEREMEEALYCPQCLPSCDDVQYSTSMMSLPMDRYKANLELHEMNESLWKTGKLSVLRVYFVEPYAQYYRRVIGNSWFEAFSTVGNFSSIFVGFSMVAIFEVVYLIVKYIWLLGRRSIHSNSERDKKRRGRDKLRKSKLLILP